MRDFTFIVITYNHEEFILEHLESIKFLINHYGHGINFTISVADDASKDNTLLTFKLFVMTFPKLGLAPVPTS